MPITPANAIPIARNVVQRVDQGDPSSLCTVPVLDEAGALLDAWCVTAAERGIYMGGADPGGEWAERLAVVALEMATRHVREPRPCTPGETTALLDAVVARLTARGITTHRELMQVPLPRTDTTPAWGGFALSSLAVTIDVECGWELVLDLSTASPAVGLVGRCDESGIEAMLDLAVSLNVGNYGDIFRR